MDSKLWSLKTNAFLETKKIGLFANSYVLVHQVLDSVVYRGFALKIVNRFKGAFSGRTKFISLVGRLLSTSKDRAYLSFLVTRSLSKSFDK